MTQHGVKCFASDIREVIDRFRSDEWDITYEEIIGSLEVIKRDLLDEIHQEDEDDA